MRLLYNSNGVINKVLWQRDDLVPVKAGLSVYVIDEISENAVLILDLVRSHQLVMAGDPARYYIVSGELYKDSDEISPIVDTNKAQVISEYQSTLATLTDIENAASPTNAQVIAAMKFMAKTLRLLLKLLVRQYI